MAEFTVFGTSSCRWCALATDLLDHRGLSYTYHVANTQVIALMRLLGYDTVPLIFKGHEEIGGYDDLLNYLGHDDE